MSKIMFILCALETPESLHFEAQRNKSNAKLSTKIRTYSGSDRNIFIKIKPQKLKNFAIILDFFIVIDLTAEIPSTVCRVQKLSSKTQVKQQETKK